MGQPAAKRGDMITATDLHLVVLTSGGPPLPPVPLPFSGALTGELSPDVRIMGQPAATQGSTAKNSPPHLPPPVVPPVIFVKPPSNKATVTLGSATVRVNGKPLARNGDKATTCNDPVDLPVGTVVAVGTVRAG